jgi:integrase
VAHSQALDKNYVPQHAKEFTVQQLFEFWASAENEGEVLRAKAVSIVGYFGLARTSELVGLTWDDFTEKPDCVVVSLARKKCAQDGARDAVQIPRITDGSHRASPADIFLVYKASVLKAPPQKGNRMWRRWDDKKKTWLAQPLGVNKLKEIPKLVAMRLGLPPAGYRGHSWRPSGASALATHGGTAAQLQTAGHWASLSVAQQYIHAGGAARAGIASVLVGPDSQPTSPTQAPQPTPAEPPAKKACLSIVFNGPLTNCTIVFN